MYKDLKDVRTRLDEKLRKGDNPMAESRAYGVMSNGKPTSPDPQPLILPSQPLRSQRVSAVRCVGASIK